MCKYIHIYIYIYLCTYMQISPHVYARVHPSIYTIKGYGPLEVLEIFGGFWAPSPKMHENR